MCLLSKLTKFFSELSLLPALSYLSYRIFSSVMNVLEGECLCLLEISINVNKLLAVLLLPVYPLFFILHFVVVCLLLNIFFYIYVVVACLLLYPIFYIAFVAIFLFIRWSCKQHYFCFWSFLFIMLISPII